MEPLTERTASSVYSDGANAAEIASLNQELEVLAAALAGLPDRCRHILRPRRIHGLSPKEIAGQLSISEHTVEKQVGIGLKKCVEFMQRRGVDRKPCPPAPRPLPPTWTPSRRNGSRGATTA